MPNGPRNYNGKIYFDKLNKLATVISQIGIEANPDGPAILGVAEVENDTVLNDLIRQPLIAKRNYKIVHYDSKDARGIDVGLYIIPNILRLKPAINYTFSFPADQRMHIIPVIFYG